MEFTIAFLILLVGGLGFTVFRLLSRVSFLEEFYEDVYRQFKPVTSIAREILGNEVYSNEPVVVQFIETLKDIDHYLQQIDPNYELETDNPDEPIQ